MFLLSHFSASLPYIGTDGLNYIDDDESSLNRMIWTVYKTQLECHAKVMEMIIKV